MPDQPLDPRLAVLLKEASKRRGIPEAENGARQRGRPPGINYKPPDNKPKEQPILASDEAANLRLLIEEKLRPSRSRPLNLYACLCRARRRVSHQQCQGTFDSRRQPLR